MTTATPVTRPGDRPSVAGTGVADDTPGRVARPGFDTRAAWTLNPKVAVRPEPFGALLYHFGTRKLSFLKNRTVVGIVQSLRTHPDAEAALADAGIDDSSRPLYVQALSALAESGMIIRREDPDQ
ncbi:mycofactocin biosynthesis chaperone MftB [Gordonia sp. X0973]|uniref:mycofactocin biosynthesis chaperone MftB n=1 Tax=Gordonia sp. X0973 TaxID=2742602 RepID=UPI000F531818|nr:mycofactocin biosynthesis chaperone MftB [Gordonia sp. X0973]QKT08226.1 mycofactocin biosynthesis chaperone MftB [Gordonia sp. X0973]